MRPLTCGEQLFHLKIYEYANTLITCHTCLNFLYTHGGVIIDPPLRC